MLNVERALVDPCIENSLPGLLSVQDGPQADPAVLQEQAKQPVGAFRVDITAFVRDARGALGAEAALARPHTQAHLATHVVQLALGQRVHDVFEHRAGGHLAFADDLLVRGPVVARLDVVEAVADRVEARFLGRRDGFVGGCARAVLAHLRAHDVDDALGHESVGGELAARDGEHAVDAVSRVVVDDAHAARHVAGVGLRHTRVLDEGTSTRPRVHRASLAEAGNHGFTRVEHLLDLVGGDRQVVGVVGLEVRRADDAHRVVGHQGCHRRRATRSG